MVCKTIIILVLSFNLHNINAKSYNANFRSTTPDSVVQLTYNCQFEEALSIVNKYLAQNPSSLQWRFFRIVILWRELLLTGHNEEITATFENETNQLIIDGEKILSNDKNNLNALFYVGATYGYLGQYKAAYQKIYSAATLGKKGIKYFNEVLKQKPDWYDAYLSLGVFNYYASNVPWYLKPILFILGKKGSEKKAIRYLTLVSKEGKLSKFEAQEYLAELYIRRKEFNFADSLYQDLIKQFPCCINYYYKLTSLKYKLNQYMNVVEIGSRAIEKFTYSEISRKESILLGMIYIMVAQGYEALGKINKAIETYTLLIEREIVKGLFSFAYLSRAKLYEKELDTTQAIESYNWVVKNSQVTEHIKEAHKRLNVLSK